MCWNLPNGGNASSCVPCLLSALSVSRRRVGGQTRRGGRVSGGRERREGRNGDFCDEIGVPGEHCLGQETAAITGERGGQEETANAASKPNFRA